MNCFLYYDGPDFTGKTEMLVDEVGALKIDFTPEGNKYVMFTCRYAGTSGNRGVMILSAGNIDTIVCKDEQK